LTIGGRWAVVLVAASLTVGCRSSRSSNVPEARSPRSVATPAELGELGTRHYADRTRDEVVAAAVTALKVLGYNVVTAEPRIRTAPLDVAATAVRGNTTAQLYTESVSWDIDVTPDGPGVTLRATPHATVNGEPMTQVYIGWAEKTFGRLMSEVDGSLAPR